MERGRGGEGSQEVSEFQTTEEGGVGTDPQEIPRLHAILQVFKRRLNVIFA